MCVPHSDTTRAFHWTESQFHFFTAASEASHYLAPVSLFSFTGLLPALLTLATSTGLLFLLLTRGQAALPAVLRVSGSLGNILCPSVLRAFALGAQSHALLGYPLGWSPPTPSLSFPNFIFLPALDY